MPPFTFREVYDGTGWWSLSGEAATSTFLSMETSQATLTPSGKIHHRPLCGSWCSQAIIPHKETTLKYLSHFKVRLPPSVKCSTSHEGSCSVLDSSQVQRHLPLYGQVMFTSSPPCPLSCSLRVRQQPPLLGSLGLSVVAYP